PRAPRTNSSSRSNAWPLGWDCAPGARGARAGAPSRRPPKACWSSWASETVSAHRCGTVAIAGRPNTGKSSLLNKLVGQQLAIVSPKAQTPRHTVTGVVTSPEWQILFVDLPGYQTKHVNALNRVLNRRAAEGASDCDVTAFVVEAGRYGAADKEV